MKPSSSLIHSCYDWNVKALVVLARKAGGPKVKANDSTTPDSPIQLALIFRFPYLYLGVSINAPFSKRCCLHIPLLMTPAECLFVSGSFKMCLKPESSSSTILLSSFYCYRISKQLVEDANCSKIFISFDKWVQIGSWGLSQFCSVLFVLFF